MEKIIVTGVTGQIGSYLVDYLLEKGDLMVFGGVRRLSVPNHDNISHVNSPRFKLIDLDVTDSNSVASAIENIRPDYFINTAANSFVGNSWSMPYNHFETNALSVLYQLEAIRKYAKDCKYLNMGSSEQFGNVDYSPQDIRHPFKPRSPYGISKCAAHYMVKVWRESYGLFANQVINFNTESERRGREFVTRKITLGVARINKELEYGVLEPIKLGNVDAKRDWQHAKDCVDGVWRILNQDKYNPNFKEIKDYVLASGEIHSVAEFVDKAFRVCDIQGHWYGSGLDKKYVFCNKILVEVDPAFFRPAEVDLLFGDSTETKKDLGWNPAINFDELVNRMVVNDTKNDGY